MNYQILSSKSFNTKEWSGGETTELYIYPPESEYGKLDFKFRLSTATVEVNTCVFTALPGVFRQLLVLEGQMELEHIGHHKKVLNSGGVDQFSGDWETHSKGVCVDFNVMTTANTKAELSAVLLNAEEKQELHLDAEYSDMFLYLYKGELNISLDDKGVLLREGELLCLKHLEEVSMLCSANLKSIAALVKVEVF